MRGASGAAARSCPAGAAIAAANTTRTDASSGRARSAFKSPAPSCCPFLLNRVAGLAGYRPHVPLAHVVGAEGEGLAPCGLDIRTELRVVSTRGLDDAVDPEAVQLGPDVEELAPAVMLAPATVAHSGRGFPPRPARRRPPRTANPEACGPAASDPHHGTFRAPPPRSRRIGRRSLPETRAPRGSASGC